MAQYVSASNRVVWGRWSPAFFSVFVLVTATALLSIFTGVRQARRRAIQTSTSQTLLDCGVAAWGVAYLISAVDDPSQGARLLDANLIGSTHPVAVLFDWAALALLVVGLTVWLFRAARGAWSNVVFSVSTVVATLVVLEGIVRLWTVIAPPTHGGLGAQMWRRRFVTLNRQHMRDIDHSVQPLPDRPRAMVIGYSFAFGWGTERIGDRFGEQLAPLLSTGGAQWEPINFSEPDRHTLQEISLLKRGLIFHPKLVVLLYVFNDMDYLAPITPRPKLRGAPNGLADRLDPRRLLVSNSYLVQELYTRFLTAMMARKGPSRASFVVYQDTALVHRHLGDLAEFVDVAKRAGAVTAIVPIDVATAIDSAALRRYEHFVEDSRTAGLPIVSIAHAFDGYSVRSLTVSRLDSHPNARAYQLAAAAAAPGVLEILAHPPNQGQ